MSKPHQPDTRSIESLWQALKEMFQHWTGMILPDAMRVPAMELIHRLATAATTEPLTYLRRVDGDPSARQALVDGLGLGTTWFMRDETGLRALVEALARSGAGARHESVWLWSVGCSSGEEPYSLAMALHDRQIQAHILATDLNRDALQRADAAWYRKAKLGRLPRPWRTRYFVGDGRDGVRVAGDIRRMVTFQLHNLLRSDGPPPGWVRFDAIICRNVLIYFERERAVEIIELLASYCRPGGYLLLGAIERPLFWMTSVAEREETAELVQVPSELGRRRAPAGARSAIVRRSRRPVQTPSEVRVVARRRRRATRPDPTVRIDHLLDQAELVEREGRPERALELVEQAIDRAKLTPQAHLAYGLILKRIGRMHEAIDAFRTARFLAADTWLAPYQLALCLEAIGEAEESLEGFRHARGVLASGGPSGYYRTDPEIENLATTALEVCLSRIAARD